MVQRTLFNVWNATLDLWDSVIRKRINLQQLKLELKQNSVLNNQVMPHCLLFSSILFFIFNFFIYKYFILNFNLSELICFLFSFFARICFKFSVLYDCWKLKLMFFSKDTVLWSICTENICLSLFIITYVIHVYSLFWAKICYFKGTKWHWLENIMLIWKGVVCLFVNHLSVVTCYAAYFGGTWVPNFGHRWCMSYLWRKEVFEWQQIWPKIWIEYKILKV